MIETATGQTLARILVLGSQLAQRVHGGFADLADPAARVVAVPVPEDVPADLDPEVLVVAHEMADSRSAAAVFRRRHPGTQILFAVPPEKADRFRASLPFAPDLAGASVISTAASADELRSAVTRLIAVARRERGMQGLYERMNAMLVGDRAAAEIHGEADAQRQQQLVLAERYLGTILTHSPQALFATDLEGKILQLNAAAERLFGRTSGRLAQMFVARSRSAVEQLLERAARGQYPELIEVALPAEPEGDIWVQLKAAPIFGSGGRVEALSLSANDITERKRAERALEETAQTLSTIANGIPQMAWMSDSEGQAQWFNDRWFEFSGLSLEESVGRGWVAVIDPDDRDWVVPRIEQHLRSREPWQDHFPLRRRDGTRGWYLSSAVPMREANGKVIRWFGTNTDVTAQVEAERSLRKLTGQLEQRVAERTEELASANQALLQAMKQREIVEERVRQMQKLEAVGQLTGGIAHDFNNLLAIIINALEVIRLYHQRGRTDFEQFIDAAFNAGRRAASLTQRLLAFARQQPLSPEPVNANQLVSSMSELISSTLRENITVDYAFEPDLWLTHVDVNQLENAILNLALNSRDAMPEGGRVTISTENLRLDERSAETFGCAPGEYVLMTVTDTGQGMTREVAERAFDPFYTTKEVGQGTGLGLSQVLGFVKQSGGHVTVHSEPGRGTSVELLLPRFRGEAGGNGGEPAEAGAEAMRAHGETILLVEDDAGVRETMKEVLSDLGYHVIEADGPLPALRLLDEHPEVELLLTDVVMPEMNGRRLAEEALRRRPQLKVLFTSGYPRDAVASAEVIDQTVHFLAKPATADQIAAKVRGALKD